jgi:hypothetical protein
MAANQPFSIVWLGLVIVSSGICIGASLAPVAFLMRPLRNRVVSRLSPRLRWLLVLPAAFAASWLGEIVPRLIFSLGEVLINRQVLFRPGFDSLVWQLWSPLVFVIGGALMAPHHRFATSMVLGGFKAAVAAINLYTVAAFILNGGQWSAVDPILSSPLWWNAVVYIACLVILTLFAFAFWRRAHSSHGPNAGQALEASR